MDLERVACAISSSLPFRPEPKVSAQLRCQWNACRQQGSGNQKSSWIFEFKSISANFFRGLRLIDIF